MPRAPKGGIILVRHGETEANRLRCFAESNDIPLTHTGRLQARELALRLSREFHPDILISSEFLRARQTSEIIAQVLGLPVEAMPGVHERDFGCLRGQPYERLGEMMALGTLGDYLTPNPPNPSLWSPPGGESLDDVRRRAIEAVEALRARHPSRQIVIVCHGAVIQAICAHITGEWTETSVPPNCGVVTIGYGPHGWDRPVLSGDWDVI
jgi:broad specificity phosphatase PhoE